MAFTNVQVISGPKALEGGGWEIISTVDWDNNYATGGESLARTLLGLANTTDPSVHVSATAKNGYSFVYDHTNQKLQAYTPLAIFTATFDPASLGATTSRDDAITVTGVAATDVCVRCDPPAAIAASVVVQNARVTGANTVTVRLTNASAGAVDVASGTWTFYVAAAGGAAHEVPNTSDLSALTAVRVTARGAYLG